MKKEVNNNSFEGFYPETLKFLENLKNNNSKKWFDSHRDQYEQYLLDPVKKFVESIKGFINYIDPQIIVEPKFNKSLVRLNKDMRFAKKPYKEYFLIRFGKFKWDCELFLYINSEVVSVGCFINNEKKQESRFHINVNTDIDKFYSVCEDYNIIKKYAVSDLMGNREVSAKFNPQKDTEKILGIKWFTFEKNYSKDTKKIYSAKFLEDVIMAYNCLYPMYLYGTSVDIKKDIKEYRNKIGILKK